MAFATTTCTVGLMKAVILAGGYGTRLGSVTEEIPKPLVRLDEDPILLHIMKIYSKAGVTDFLILGGYKIVEIIRYFEQTAISIPTAEIGTTEFQSIEGSWRIQILDSGENTGTAGRLKKAKSILANEEKFFLTYGDAVSDIDIQDLLEAYEKSSFLSFVTGVRPLSRFGKLVIEGDGVKQFIEKSRHDHFVNGGFMILDSSIWPFLDVSEDEASLEIHILPRLADLGNLGIYRFEGFWECMDTPRDLNSLRTLLSHGEAPWKWWD